MVEAVMSVIIAVLLTVIAVELYMILRSIGSVRKDGRKLTNNVQKLLEDNRKQQPAGSLVSVNVSSKGVETPDGFIPISQPAVPAPVPAAPAPDPAPAPKPEQIQQAETKAIEEPEVVEEPKAPEPEPTPEPEPEPPKPEPTPPPRPQMSQLYGNRYNPDGSHNPVKQTLSGLTSVECPNCKKENSTFRNTCFNCGEPL